MAFRTFVCKKRMQRQVVAFIDEDAADAYRGACEAARQLGISCVGIAATASRTAPEPWLFVAIGTGDMPAVEAAFRRDPGAANRVVDPRFGTYPIHVAASYATAGAVLAMLLARPDVDVDVRSKSGRTALAYAMASANADAADALVRSGRCRDMTFPPREDGTVDLPPPLVEHLVAALPPATLAAVERIYRLLPETRGAWDEGWRNMFDRAPQAAARAAAPAPAPGARECDDGEACMHDTCDAATGLCWHGVAHPAPETGPPVAECDVLGKEELCVVCMAAKPSTIVLPCHHMVVCKACSLRMRDDRSVAVAKQCAVCRGPVEGVWLCDDDEMQPAEDGGKMV